MHRTLFFLFLLLASVAFSQKPEIQIDRISVSKGFLSHSINCITQDHTGFIWIGGSDGLYRYDGYEFTNYQYNPGEKSYRIFKEVYRIREDRYGLLWILSEKGIILFDPETERSVLLYPYTYELKSDILNYRPDILIDPDDNIWATYRRGLIKISCHGNLKQYIKTEKIFNSEGRHHFTTNIIELPFSDSGQNNLVIKLYQDRNQNILIGCTSDFFLLNTKKETLTRLTKGTQTDPQSGFNYVRSIVQDKDNSYWIAADNFIYNLTKINPEQNIKTLNISSAGLTRYSIGEGQVPTSLLVDHKNNILVGTDKEIYRIIRETKNSIRFSLMDTNENDPEFYGYSKTIRDIFEDRVGVIWTAQDYYGITRFNLNSSQFNSYKSLIIKNFKSTDINPVYKDRNGNLWIGTYGGGLYKISADKKTVSQFNMFRQKNNIVCLKEISDGLFWIGTDRGLVEFNASTGKSGNPQADALKIIDRKGIYIWDLLKDKDLMYIGSGEGLFVFDLRLKSLTHYPLVKNTPLIKDDSLTGKKNQVFSLLRMKNGEILAGTSYQGIFKISYPDSKPAITRIADNKTLTDKGINLDERHRLFEDNNGLIWIADYSGLHRLNLQTSEITSYKLFERINFPVAWSITEDDHDNLWIGTHFGLCRFNRDSAKVRVYTKENGLPVTIHGFNSVLKDKDGRLYFGGIGGFYDFYPDSLKVNNSVPPVVITDILLFNKSLKPDTSKQAILHENISYVKTIKLKYYQNDIAIKFSALDFNQPLRNQYSYMLGGYQDQWMKTDANNRVASYLKLKPGTFIFRVKGSNGDGVWNRNEASLKIIIRKPWWSTHVARIAYIIIIITGITGIFRWRLYRLQKEREELENLVRIRTSEIEEQSHKISEQKDLLEEQNKKIREDEELKSRFFSNVSHEFRTPLSLIKSPAEEMLDDPHLNEKGRRKLNMINRNAQRLLNLVNQLLDLSKFDGNKMILEISQGDVMKYLNNIAASFTSLAETKSISYQCYSDHLDLITWFDHDKIEKIATNLLSNAFKFTPAGGEIEFRAGYIRDNDPDSQALLEFSVKDNGPGIPEKSLNKIFDRFYQVEETLGTENFGTGIGLSLSRDLTRLMHGNISVTSKQNSGSTFVVRIPLGKNHLNENEFVVVKNAPEVAKTTEELNVAYLNSDSDESEAARSNKGKLSVLIIDDNRDLRNQLYDNLSSLYNVSLAVDGVGGLKKALDIMPDLIITDLMMPKMDGMELCRKLKENELTSHIPIIILTAKDTLVDKIEGLQTGADDYIPKPFNMSELKVRIANLIGQRKKLRERFGKEITLEPGDIIITPADEAFINRAISIVEKHIKDEKFNPVVFREEMNLSRSTLARKLSAVTGQSPSEFTRIIRLKRAAKLLKQKFGNVTEVAYEVGFNDISYFNRCFKKAYGISPAEYAKKPEIDDQG